MTTLSVALRTPRATSAPVRFWHAAFVVMMLIGCFAVLSCTADGLPIGPTNTGGQTDGGTTDGNGNGNGNGTGSDSSSVDSTGVDSTGVDSTGVDSTGVDSSKVDSSSVDPGDPGSADIHVTVDATQTTPISPWIYGVNALTEDGQAGYAPWYGARLPSVFTLNREGGNRWSAYNWENNYSNAGSDYGPFSNDAYLSSSRTPGEAVRSRASATFARNAALLVTVPMLEYVAADGSGPTGSGTSGRATRLASHFRHNLPEKGSALSLTPNTGDDAVYQDEFVHWLTNKFPGQVTNAAEPIFFSLDNEPDDWPQTHAESVDSLLTYDGFIDRTIAYATAIKDQAPGAMVFGPAVATYAGIAALDRIPNGSWQPDPDHGKDFFLDVYLDQLRAAEQKAGHRLVDVVDVHWYPEDAGGESEALADARLQAPRSLWDPTYLEGSWVNDAAGGPIQLIPRLRSHIAAHDPGAKIAITEYYYGSGGHISGGLAQADVLGIFGREGVFAATLWPQANVSSYGGDGTKAYAYIFGAFDLFRNYDGAGSTIGDREAKVTTSDTARSSVYAAVDANGHTVLVAINKTSSTLTMGIAVTGPAATTASIYTMANGSPTPTRGTDVPSTAQNAFVITLPAMSASTIVLH
jgi:hypothetical protein